MANTRKETDSFNGDELVEVKLSKDRGRNQGDQFVGVNGDRILIQRGQRVQIKAKFAEALKNSQEQDEATASMIEDLTDDFKEKEKQFT